MESERAGVASFLYSTGSRVCARLRAPRVDCCVWGVFVFSMFVMFIEFRRLVDPNVCID